MKKKDLFTTLMSEKIVRRRTITTGQLMKYLFNKANILEVNQLFLPKHFC